MISWPAPHVPAVPGSPVALSVHDPVADRRVPVRPGPVAGLYVCGITPYDATHLGHAATYLTFDLVNRILRDNGHDVNYAQNITDIDDPLLERAHRDDVDWRKLAHQETELFREDMTALSILPPRHFVGVVDSIPDVVADVSRLRERGAGYSLAAGEPLQPGADADYYLDISGAPGFGEVSGFTAEQMLSAFAERGGDPHRPGKRNPLDPLLWRAARTGEPAWPGGPLGLGRPGWHIECTTIALRHLGATFDIQGGGTDLLFPHHEMSAAQAQLLGGNFAQHYIHQAMVGLGGQKMS
ncbi:MAG: cysteine--1-D-myo-inosityl 2-amino-2-deoxy-alpha-D-glucopyranoside ligase, partial [Angustibacter sp.]